MAIIPTTDPVHPKAPYSFPSKAAKIIAASATTVLAICIIAPTSLSPRVIYPYSYNNLNPKLFTDCITLIYSNGLASIFPASVSVFKKCMPGFMLTALFTRSKIDPIIALGAGSTLHALKTLDPILTLTATAFSIPAVLITHLVPSKDQKTTKNNAVARALSVTFVFLSLVSCLGAGSSSLLCKNRLYLEEIEVIRVTSVSCLVVLALVYFQSINKIRRAIT